jgi:hypothetical protein
MQTVMQKAPAAPWYRHRWPWFIMLGPVAVMLATLVSVLLAVRQPDAMVVDDYYKQGKAINQDLRRDRMATGLRLHLEARYERTGGRLTGRLESFGRPLTAPLRIHLAHPTQPHKDLVLDAFPDGQGDFAVPLAALEMTHWQVVVEDEGRQWRLARSWSPGKDAALAIVADAPL